MKLSWAKESIYWFVRKSVSRKVAARITVPKRNAVLADIREHLREHGPNNWAAVQNRHRDVAHTTFWRYVKRVQKEGVEDARKHQRGYGENVHKANEQIKNAIAERAATHIPATPSPALVALSPERGMQAFDFITHFNILMDDIETLRATAIGSGENGQAVEYPPLFDRAIMRRMEMIKLYLQSMDIVWNLEKMQDLYRIIIKAIGEADQDTQQVILHKLQEANDKLGLTTATAIQ